MLKLVKSPRQKSQTLPKRDPRHNLSKIAFKKLFDSDKIKFQRALALQRMALEPDNVFMEIKYHFTWNVIGRKPMFKNSFNKIDFICEAFSNCGEMVGGFVSLLWLAPDHVHVYVESDGEFPVESIAQKMKRSTSASILAEFTDLKVSPHAENELWDKAYFVETIG